jgi:hypothetical protein
MSNIKVDNVIPQHLTIKDIYYPLFKYGMLHNTSSDNSWLHNYSITFFMLFNVIRWFIIINLSPLQSIYFGDVYIYFGGLRIYLVSCAFFVALTASALLLLFKLNNNINKLNCMELLAMLNGITSSIQLIIDDERLVDILKRARRLMMVIKYVSNTEIIICSLLIIIIYGYNCNSLQMLIIFIPLAIVNVLWGYYIIKILCHSIGYIYLICYYLILIINQYNKQIEQCIYEICLPASILNPSINITPIINKQNEICKKISDYDSFLKYIFLIILTTLMPCNLFPLHQLLFGKSQFMIKLVLFCVFVLFASLMLLVGISSASISNKIHQSYIKLNLLISHANHYATLSQKLKVI